MKTLTVQKLEGPYWNTRIVNTRTIQLRKKASSVQNTQPSAPTQEVVEETLEEGKVTPISEKPKNPKQKKKTKR